MDSDMIMLELTDKMDKAIESLIKDLQLLEQVELILLV